jgi:hypothetical protein
MQPAVALIGDGKHDKNKDKGANELEWEMGDRNQFDAEIWFGKGGARFLLHRKSNWLTTRRRAKPEESTTVRYGLTGGGQEKQELTGYVEKRAALLSVR